MRFANVLTVVSYLRSGGYNPEYVYHRRAYDLKKELSHIVIGTCHTHWCTAYIAK